MLARAAAEAAVALMLGGTLAARGWAGLLRVWGWAVPYLAFFLALELALGRRGAGAARVFSLGAAFALLYEGVYAKSVIDGVGLLGIDPASLAAACFDWGMLAVMAAHLVSRRSARRAAPGEPLGAHARLAAGALGLLCVGAAAVYLVKTRFGHYIAERMVGPTWLLTDVLFAAGAWRLSRAALAGDGDPAEPARWMYVLCAFASWVPGVQSVMTWGDEFSWPAAVIFLLVVGWTAACGWGFWRLWRGRGFVDETPTRDCALISYAAAWRVVGSAALLLAYSPGVFDERAAAAYAVLIDLPSRLAFSYAFLTSRLDV